MPQWLFVTPNLFDDGHNTDIHTSCAWTRGFVESLPQNTYFNNNTLVYVTWQANGDAPGLANHVAGILLGSAVSQNLVGTVDDNYYNHYSELASVESNWDLHTLGRWDVGANDKIGDVIRHWNPHIAHGSFGSYLWNQSYGGVFSNANDTTHTYVAPSLNIHRNGRTVLPAIADVWRVTVDSHVWVYGCAKGCIASPALREAQLMPLATITICIVKRMARNHAENGKV